MYLLERNKEYCIVLYCVRKEFHLNVYCLTCFKQSGMDNVSLYVLWLLNEKDSLCQVAALGVLTV